MADQTGRRLGDILLAARQITQSQLDEALTVKQYTGERLGDVLVGLGTISEANLTRALAAQLGLPVVEPERLQIDSAAASLLSAGLARRYRAVPFARSGNLLSVAMADPLDVTALTDLAMVTGCEIRPAVATGRAIDQALAIAYPGLAPATSAGARSTAASVVLAQAQVAATGSATSIAASSLTQNPPFPTTPTPSFQPTAASGSFTVGGPADPGVGESPAVRIIESLIDQALELRASDIHIEPSASGVLIRMRVDGILREALRTPPALHAALTARVKVMSSLDIAERRVPQDGRAFIKDGRRDVDLRVSTLPTIHGEKIALRIFDRSQPLAQLADLGIGPETLPGVVDLIERPHGMVLVTGPTGSGKTTTLTAVLRRLTATERNIVTVEDPVEYELAGVNQVQVNEKAGLTFAAGLRSILRQDPDVIMVGEIRDAETAAVAVRAALTGHLVLSTVHTNDAAATVGRLVDIGVPPFLLGSALNGVIAQRLVRRLCPVCRVEHDLPPDAPERDLFGLGSASLRVWRPTGCAACGLTGYRGRVALMEVMVVDSELRRAIAAGQRADQLRAIARRAGARSLTVDGVGKARAGITSFAEVRRAAFDDER